MVVILWITLEAATERVMSDKKKMMVVIAVGEKIRKDRENERQNRVYGKQNSISYKGIQREVAAVGETTIVILSEIKKD